MLFCLWFPSSTSFNFSFVNGFRRCFLGRFRRRRKRVLFYGFRRWFFHGFRRGRKTFLMVSVAGLLVDSAAARGSMILECIERFLVFGVLRTGFRRWFYGQENMFFWFPSFFYDFRRCREQLLMVSVVFCMVVGCYRTAAVSPMEAVNKKTPGRFRDELSVCIYIYIFIYRYMYTLIPLSLSIYIYIYVDTHV